MSGPSRVFDFKRADGPVMVRSMIGRTLALALLTLVAFAQPASAQRVTTERATAVVELFTSQGCIQCPRANRLLGMFAREEGVLALTFPVGIWDYLGWEDTFASPLYADRQRLYSRAMRNSRFTPQLVINGATQVSASYWDEARALLEAAEGDLATAPRLTLTRPRTNAVRVTLGAGQPRTPADVWLVAYDPGPVDVFVTRGLNHNRRIYHYNLVESLERLGTWNGEAVYFERSRCEPECAVILQEPNGGRIIAAATTRRVRS